MSDKPPKQRLILCLDGTWNNKDDSTNVLHHFVTAIEGTDGDGVYQRRYYHEGVGTGLLDGVTGGGFGFGLEQNVRDAYNWLIEHFEESDKSSTGNDHVFIFGFSRGAYTARSLVGLINRVGLLRRGAPLTVNQLWKEYCLLGRENEGRKSFWDGIFGEEKPNVRAINQLITDPWEGSRPRADDLNETEILLTRWSRRVKITYLGLYDTVGAMGWDALAIPGLKSKLALHHNMRSTSLIQKCRHALAWDEHRSGFNHTPFQMYIGQGDKNGGIKTGDEEWRQNARDYWLKQKKVWEEKIEQRWFVGAHSNVGGGYSNNELAQLSFKWVLHGAVEAGMICKNTSPIVTNNPLKLTDSYAEFVKPLWTMFLRSKRNYRLIDPAPERRANGRKSAHSETPAPGFMLQSVNERIANYEVDHTRLSALLKCFSSALQIPLRVPKRFLPKQ